MCPPSEFDTLRDGGNATSVHSNNGAIPDCVPSDDLSQAAYAYACKSLHPLILNHSLRVFLYMVALSHRDGTTWHDAASLPVLFTAAMFHDMGSADAPDGPQRFEIEGADAAVNFLTSHDISSAEAREVWIAIACHTSAGIGERISPLGRLVRLGPLVDFKRADVLAMVDGRLVERNEQLFPRGEIEKILSDTVVEQAMRQRTKAPHATWPGGLMRFKDANPEWDGVNKEF